MTSVQDSPHDDSRRAKSLLGAFALLMGLAGLTTAAGLVGCGSDPSASDAPGGDPSSDGGDPRADGALGVDATANGDASGAGSSRCEVTPTKARCSSQVLGLDAIVVTRDVVYEVPTGTPPPSGWPVVIYFQGSLVSKAFEGDITDRFGVYHLTVTIKELLDHGYAVLAPAASLDGTTAWQTNVPPWSIAWETSSDHAFMKSLFDAIGARRFGPLDPARLYAMGISSGGFMTSRMAVSYAGKFRALAIHSASYATCSALCVVPDDLPTDHPPTIFLHGAKDDIVPADTMVPYHDALEAKGRAVETVLDPNAGHEWLSSAPAPIRAWFDGHP